MIKWLRARSYRPSNVSEAELLKKAIRGDNESFGELYLRHLDAIYRYIYFRVSDRYIAETLTTQVFTRAWKKINRLDEKKDHSFVAWVYQITRNAIIDHYRKQTSKSETRPDKLPEILIDKQPQPDEKVVLADELDHLEGALLRLSDEQREVVLLRFVEEWSYEEISRLTGKSPVALRAVISRALKLLNQYLTQTKQM